MGKEKYSSDEELIEIINNRIMALNLTLAWKEKVKQSTHYVEGEIHSLEWLKIRLGIRSFK